MPPAFRYQTAARWTIGTTLVASVALGGFYYRTWYSTRLASPVFESPRELTFQGSSSSATGQFWSVLQSRADKQNAGTSRQATPDRFRLAGTFFIEGAGEPQRRAILDDTTKKEQFIVGEGERLADATVEKIFVDHVVLQTPAGRREIWVDFAGGISPLLQPSGSTNKMSGSTGATNKFGCVQTEENRWKFSRKPILDYYQELLDEPDRMVAVFDTMKPVRDEKNRITGYVVGLEGEKDFFDAVGLKQGDIVRSVNSMPMTNRRRAEAFIDQFLKDQMSAVVLEVERDGKTDKQIYQMQP